MDERADRAKAIATPMGNPSVNPSGNPSGNPSRDPTGRAESAADDDGDELRAIRELVARELGGEVAGLEPIAAGLGTRAFLRVHLTGIGPEQVREQIDALGRETLPQLRDLLSDSHGTR